MSKAIELQSKVSNYAADLVQFGQVRTEEDRNAEYLKIMDASAQIDDAIFEVSEMLKAEQGKADAKTPKRSRGARESNPALDKMMDIGASLASSVTAVNNAVAASLALANTRIQTRKALETASTNAVHALVTAHGPAEVADDLSRINSILSV